MTSSHRRKRGADDDRPVQFASRRLTGGKKKSRVVRKKADALLQSIAAGKVKLRTDLTSVKGTTFMSDNSAFQSFQQVASFEGQTGGVDAIMTDDGWRTEPDSDHDNIYARYAEGSTRRRGHKKRTSKLPQDGRSAQGDKAAHSRAVVLFEKLGRVYANSQWHCTCSGAKDKSYITKVYCIGYLGKY